MDALYYDAASCDLAAFQRLTSQTLNPGDVPHAQRVAENVPLYDMARLRPALGDLTSRRALMAEWAWVLGRSAGVIVLQNAYADLSVIDRASEVMRALIAEERQRGATKGDHFAAAGANDRVWNSLQKHCLRDPMGFALYFGNDAIAAVCEAWLGPAYQMTAQLNQVRPGGTAQAAHRDYHLGFQTAERAALYPRHAHEVTATLTLQGGIAHCDMPVDSGPTKLLPFSQLYGPGYLAFHAADFRDWFETRHVQLPLGKGDALFFNPALFHAAGENRTRDVQRMVNLLQVSSAFGRAMEQVDRAAMSVALLPALTDLRARGWPRADLDAAMAACAEGYPFPTNLDTDPPVGGNAPPSMADMLRDAVDQGTDPDRFAAQLRDLQTRQTA